MLSDNYWKSQRNLKRSGGNLLPERNERNRRRKEREAAGLAIDSEGIRMEAEFEDRSIWKGDMMKKKNDWEEEFIGMG